MYGFSSNLAQYVQLCSKYLGPDQNSYGKSLSEYEEAGINISEDLIISIEKSNKYNFIKEPRDGDWEKYHKFHRQVQKEFVAKSYEVSSKYKVFRKLIKKKLLI